MKMIGFRSNREFKRTSRKSKLMSMLGDSDLNSILSMTSGRRSSLLSGSSLSKDQHSSILGASISPVKQGRRGSLIIESRSGSSHKSILSSSNSKSLVWQGSPLKSSHGSGGESFSDFDLTGEMLLSKPDKPRKKHSSPSHPEPRKPAPKEVVKKEENSVNLDEMDDILSLSDEIIDSHHSRIKQSREEERTSEILSMSVENFSRNIGEDEASEILGQSLPRRDEIEISEIMSTKDSASGLRVRPASKMDEFSDILSKQSSIVVNSTVSVADTKQSSHNESMSASLIGEHDHHEELDQISSIDGSPDSNEETPSEKSLDDYLDFIMNDVVKDTSEKEDNDSPESNNSMNELESMIQTMRSSATSNSDIEIDFIGDVDGTNTKVESGIIVDDFTSSKVVAAVSSSIVVEDPSKVVESSQIVEDFVSSKVVESSQIVEDFVSSKVVESSQIVEDFVSSKVIESSQIVEDFVDEEESVIDLGGDSSFEITVDKMEGTVEDFIDDATTNLDDDFVSFEEPSKLVSTMKSDFVSSEESMCSSSSGRRKRRHHHHKREKDRPAPALTLETPVSMTVRGQKELRIMNEHHKVQFSMAPARKPKQENKRPAALFEPRVLSSATLGEVNACYRESIRSQQAHLSLLNQSISSFLITRRMQNENRRSEGGITLDSVSQEIRTKIQQRRERQIAE